MAITASGVSASTAAPDRVEAIKQWLDRHRDRLVALETVQIVFDCAGPTFDATVKETIRWRDKGSHGPRP